MFRSIIFHVLIVVLIQKRTLAFHAVTENNHVLVGHVFQQLHARDWFNCIQACHDEPRCISYNYERSAGANGLCELNDNGAESFCERDKSLLYSKGFVFQQIRENKYEKICSLEKAGPSAPPQFVRAVHKTMGSIGVTCNEVPTGDQNGVIVNYTVTYHSVTPGYTVEEKSVISLSRFATLTNLTRNTNYSITVVASNQCGNGPPSSPMFVITSDGSVFQCPLEKVQHKEDAIRLFKDPNSCFHYYKCDLTSAAIVRVDCRPGKEFKESPSGSSCDYPDEPFCHV